MATRRFDFISGIESSTAPTATDPVNPSDPTTLGFSDGRYVQGGPAVADVAALKALDVSERQDKDAILVESLSSFYSYDAGGTGTNDDDFIIQPTAGAGRWFKVTDFKAEKTLPFQNIAITPTTPASGNRLIYATSAGFKQMDDAGVVADLGGSGGGTGEVNVIQTPSTATDWAASGAGITVATTTTTSELPLGGVIPTAILITPVSGTDYVRYRWTMPESLKNSKQKFAFVQRALAGYTAGDLKVEIHTNTQSDYAGTDDTLALGSDVSGVTEIDAVSKTFQTSFDADASDYYELRVIRVAGTSPLSLANVVVGPGTITQGPIVSDWSSYTPTTQGFGTITSPSVYYRRVGSSIEVQGEFTTGTVAGTEAQINLPSSLTLGGPTGPIVVGKFDSDASQSDNNHNVLASSGDAFVNIARHNMQATATNMLSPALGNSFASSTTRVSFFFSAQITEWAGTGIVNNPAETDKLSFQERASTPGDPTVSDEAKIYVKADKLVIQFNDAGTVRYKYLDLTGTGITWTHTTSAP